MCITNIAKVLGISMALCAVTYVLPATADEVVIKTTQGIQPAPQLVVPSSDTTILKTVTTETHSTTPQIPNPTTILGQDSLASLRSRLENMSTQIDSGLAKGWLTTFQADVLRQKAKELIATVNQLRKGNYTKGQADDVERQANLLNESISDTMQHTPAIGSTKESTE